MKKNALALLLLILLSLITVLPVFSSGYFPMHDDTQVARVVAMGRALNDGQFPVRWVSDLGYGLGYPIFNYYAPLPYYFGGGLYALGLNGLTATKAMFIAGILIGAVTMYLLVSRYYGILAGILSAILFSFVPYKAVDIYVRGAVGEYWAMAFIPLTLMGILSGFNKVKQNSSYLLGAFGLAGIILSHTIMGYICTGILMLLIITAWLIRLILGKEAVNLSAGIKTLIFGLMLSCFFWLPALTEMKYTSLQGMLWDKTDFRDHFICPFQLWNSPWGFGGSVPGCTDGMSFKLGKVHIIAALFSVIGFFVFKKIKKTPLFISGIVITIGSLVMTLSWSGFIWNIIPMASYIQYPWRFLSLTAVGVSLLGGPAVTVWKKKIWKLCYFLLLSGVLIVVNRKLFKPQYIYPVEPLKLETREEISFRASKVSDEYLPPDIEKPESVKDIIRDTIQKPSGVYVEEEVIKSNYLKLRFIAEKESRIILNRAFFPGWKYRVNDTWIHPEIIHGLPEITIPQGGSTVQIWFQNTNIRTVANLITIMSLIYLLLKYGKKTLY